MKIGPILIILGLIMIICGLVLFYSIPSDLNLDDFVRSLKHGGTFVGLMGIGVFMAGLLLYLIGREEPQFQKDFGV